MNSPKKNIVLVGGGGHCKSCIEVIESTNLYNIVGILDLPAELGKKVLNYKVVGNDDDYEKFKQQNCSFLVTTGQLKSSRLRNKIFENLKKIGANIETVIASTAIVSKNSQIAVGSIVMHHGLVNAGAKIGKNCIINTAAVIEHDVLLGDNTHISTNTVINGDCTVGSDVFIGSSSCISNGVQIGSDVIIGAGSLVLKNILESGTYVGSPVKKSER